MRVAGLYTGPTIVNRFGVEALKPGFRLRPVGLAPKFRAFTSTSVTSERIFGPAPSHYLRTRALVEPVNAFGLCGTVWGSPFKGFGLTVMSRDFRAGMIL
jgi:hypothetical protein